MTTAAAATSTTTKPQAEVRVLIVDDEPRVLTSLRMLFKMASFAVDTTTDGAEAIQMLKKREYHVICCDQRMPGLSGIEVLRAAKAVSINTVRILLTGYADKEAITEGINEAEIHRFLRKPWDNTQMRQVMDESIRIASALLATKGRYQPKPDDPVTPVGHTIERITTTKAANDGLSFRAPVPDIPKEDRYVVVVERSGALVQELRTQADSSIQFAEAPTLLESLPVLGKRPCSVMIVEIKTSEQADRMFLAMMKERYPHILVIAVCDDTDINVLSDLINFAKVYKYVQKPAKIAPLLHCVSSALSLAHEHKLRPNVLLLQKGEAIPAPKEGTAASQIFASLKTALQLVGLFKGKGQ